MATIKDWEYEIRCRLTRARRTKYYEALETLKGWTLFRDNYRELSTLRALLILANEEGKTKGRPKK